MGPLSSCMPEAQGETCQGGIGGSRLRYGDLEGHLNLGPKPEGLETTARKISRDLCSISPETLSNHIGMPALGDRENWNKASSQQSELTVLPYP